MGGGGIPSGGIMPSGEGGIIGGPGGGSIGAPIGGPSGGAGSAGGSIYAMVASM